MIRFYDAHRLPVRVLFSTLAEVRAQGVGHLPRAGGVVLVSNHLTDLDPLLLGALFPRPLHFMAKEELFRFRPLGWWLRRAGTFPVRRGEVDRAALRHAETLLRDGEVVMIFPEGHRSASAAMQAARTGAVLLASRASCPIVPVGIAGTEHLRRAWMQRDLRGLLLNRPGVTVRVGEPLYPDAAGRGAGRKQQADLVMRRIGSLLPPAYRGVYALG